MQAFRKTTTILFKSGAQFYKNTSPLIAMNFTMRVAIYIRLFQLFARRLGNNNFRKLTMFRAKKFYVSFRPIQKLKQYSRIKKNADDEAVR